MIRKRPLFVCLLVAVAVAATGIDWTGAAASGTTIESRRSGESGTDVVTVRDGSRRYDVTFDSRTLTERAIGRIRELAAEAGSWPAIQIRELLFEVRGDSVVMAVLPQSVRFEGQEMGSALPAGMVFVDSDALRYDFRMTKDNLFLRVRGRFVGIDELLSRMQSALANPVAFIQTNDLNSLAARIARLDEGQQVHGAELDELLHNYETLLAAHTTLEERFEIATEDIVNENRAAITQVQSELAALIRALAGETQQLEDQQMQLISDIAAERQRTSERIDDLDSRLEALAVELDDTFLQLDASRQAQVALELKGAFGGPRPVAAETIASVVDLKRQRATLSVDQVRGFLAQQGAEIDRKVIEAIFRVYFADFPE